MRMRAFYMIAISLVLISPCLLAQTEGDYRIGAEDVLQISVWQRPDLTIPATVDLSGEIILPLLGTIQAQGYTPAELGDLLTERFQLFDPKIGEVTVSVIQYNSRRVTVVGAVLSPGRFSFAKIPDLWSVLLTAGGTRPEADLARVLIVHSEEESGAERTVTVDLSNGIEDTPADALPLLRPQDTIIVPTMGESVVSGDKIQILGAVLKPGAYSVSAAETLVEALSVSGGSLPTADLRHVRLTRPTSGGAISYEFDLYGYLHEAKPVANMALNPGDMITVPSRERTLASVLLDTVRIVPMITSIVSLVLVLR